MAKIRKFALVVIDDFDKEVERFELEYADTPKNLGFELEFTTLESRLTTVFTSAREKKLATTLNLNFLPPNAYEKVNKFKRFVQKHIGSRMIFEYDDTTEVKNWEGKIQKLGQEELNEYKSLVCPITFVPATPKYIKKDNVITIRKAGTGKNYPFQYPYNYGKLAVENNKIENEYFDDIPLRAYIYGVITNPQISLQDLNTGEIYSTVRFENLFIADGEHLVIDAINSKVLLYRNNKYISAYDYLAKDSSLDSFLFVAKNSKSAIVFSFSPTDSGYMTASYRQYTL